jgi:hypothetical protein
MYLNVFECIYNIFECNYNVITNTIIVIFSPHALPPVKDIQEHNVKYTRQYLS